VKDRFFSDAYLAFMFIIFLETGREFIEYLRDKKKNDGKELLQKSIVEFKNQAMKTLESAKD
jgi:hypothetical protein